MSKIFGDHKNGRSQIEIFVCINIIIFMADESFEIIGVICKKPQVVPHYGVKVNDSLAIL